MNKYILCAMNKIKTSKDLKKNADAADAAYYAYADAYADAAYDAAYAADAADAAYDAAQAAYDAAYDDEMDYWLDRYFRRTGENRKDYEKAIKELEK